MSSSHVNLSSNHSDSQSYTRDTLVNQEFVNESQAATPTKIALQEAGLSKRKNKRTLVKGANLPPSSEAAPGDKAGSSQGKDKQGEDPNHNKEVLTRRRRTI
ncbi:hypothetical protein LIER_04971 [Lithospermum erythrorhizon]|uniref:Uncharacterized protein n=1 Tax=Lithospermum erythrorhizon TaxID=34254 RepID=A0AAV3P3F6_LITER